MAIAFSKLERNRNILQGCYGFPFAPKIVIARKRHLRLLLPTFTSPLLLFNQ